MKRTKTDPKPSPDQMAMARMRAIRQARASNAVVATRYHLYDGAELRPFEGRPGAMDAYALPSLVRGQRVPRGRVSALRASGRGAAR